MHLFSFRNQLVINLCPQVPCAAEVADVHFELVNFTVPEVSGYHINLITEPDIYLYSCRFCQICGMMKIVTKVTFKPVMSCLL